ncbi:hypothetical protein FNH05_01340 [Amycolatopsis rhizosphaerae]|uniref:Uncharacterized protein n=1 Tax=Amycolatopsis rhizosphaerae TaxID=2053003 RepID=A0A558DMA6_9PSEU|nr:hypothetical protein [Amycolatopsis rhizosphaerae]TVT62147.1 hypothetical protein FNH05_01340 [Amycolatopsis rhizosphaerae]
MPREPLFGPARRRILSALAGGAILLFMTACRTSDTAGVGTAGGWPVSTPSATSDSTEMPATSSTRMPSTSTARRTSSSATVQSSQAPRATLITCDGTAASSPSRYTLTCGDAGIWLDGLRWSAWGSTTAQASGNLWANDCNPTCAGGHNASHPATVTVSGLTGGQYTRIHVEVQGDSPYDYSIGANGPEAP